MCSAASSDRYLVHGHTVTPATCEIASGDTVIRIEPKSMEVLVYLFAHQDSVVSREQIHDAIWGDVVVGDDSLTNAIIKIRKAFGDNARNPSVIETIPKRGYRLIAEVTTPKPPVAKQSFGWVWVSVTLVLLLLGSVAITLFPRTEAAAPQIKLQSDAQTRIVVSPFVNLSGDASQDYLVRGMEQTVVTGLAAIPHVSAMQSHPRINQADYRLEGSVWPTENRILIHTRLLDGEDGTVLAIHRHDRAYSDLLTVMTEIETTITSDLALEIEQANLSAQARGYTDSVEAFDLFLQAQAALLPRDRSGTSLARALYERAIARDPRFARAYGGLALVHAAEYRNDWAEDSSLALNRALSMAGTALSIQPNLPEQYWVIGYVHTQRRQLEDAETALHKALALDPSHADALALLGGIRTYAGQPDKSIPLLRKAMRRNPRAGYLYFMLLGRAYYYLGDCGQAQINLHEAARRNPSNLETRLYMAACQVQFGDPDEAAWEVEEILGQEPEFSLTGFLRTYPMEDDGQITMLTRDLKLAGLP